MWTEFGPVLVQVELLIAKPKRHPALPERLAAHPELLIKVDGRSNVGDRQNQVVERLDPHHAQAYASGRATRADAKRHLSPARQGGQPDPDNVKLSISSPRTAQTSRAFAGESRYSGCRGRLATRG